MKSDDAALSDLCAQIFREPARIVDAKWIAVQSAIKQPVHSHTDLLQLDLAIGCSGHWTTATKPIELDGTTAAVFYPRFRHGYALQARRHDANLFSVKLRVSKSWPAIRGEIFVPAQRGIAGTQQLTLALRQLCRLVSTRSTQHAFIATSVAQMLCAWPRGDSATPNASDGEGELTTVLALIDERLSRPPSIEELAARANMSSRHLTRRMRALLGCSPHDYLTARRVARAKELLAHSGMSVTATADALGFPSIHTFSRWFTRETRITPKTFQRHPAIL